ncbi:MAG: cobaltochelatase subunit CobN, partial [Methanobacterium sp.]|nr:cobaltochelatase subunit CobN [Methanobacterium sp.]
GSGNNATLNLFQQLNVPVMSPIMVYSLSTLDEYLQNSTGLFGSELLSWVAAPELDGRTIPILIGGTKIVGAESITGTYLKSFAPYQPGIEQLADQIVAWANLKHKDNADKKISLVYADNTHDETMPVSGNLNLVDSITNIIKAMAQNGYNFGSLDVVNLTSDDILALIKDRGRNPLNYTSTQLEQLIQKGVVTISRSEYLQMYYKLPESLRAQVEAMWGPPIGDMMTYDDKIVIPGIMLGNIFLGPQPIWKWNGTISSLHDEKSLPPTHQYIAFYLWMQKMFDADAMVQVGQHGTLELLPGHSTGLTEEDWPNTLIGNIPHIYLYNMANPGEANPAKRRAYATIISYLTPPLTETQLYGNYAVMHNLVDSFNEAYTYNNTERMNLLKDQIWEKINSEAGLAERLDINSSTSFGIVLNKLHDYLHELQSMYTPYGLHVFGELPDNDTLEKWLDAIIAFDPENRASRRDEIRNLLIQSAADEMNSLLNALNGGFILPGVSGDVVRSLALPTGRNIYAYDPRTVPDSVATIIGKKSVEAMLERYLQANSGKYPETVAMPISGGEVMVTKGQSVASAFYLLGVEPIYFGTFVVGTKVIPLEQLGRSRIDIIIQASSSFRDAHPDVIRWIDEAVKQVALLNEPTELNFVRKHYLDMIPSLEADLISQGLTIEQAKSQAERLARARIFSLPPGADSHGAGVNRLLRSLDDWTEEEIADLYMNYNSYVYGKDLSGVKGNFLMEKLLHTVDTTMAISYTVTPGRSYTSSGVFNFMVERLTGRTITSYIIKTGDGNPKALTVKEKILDDLTLTLFNPTWREGMLKQGFSGQVTIALSIRRIFTNDALVDVVSADVWQKIGSTYLFDENMYNQLDPSVAEMIRNVIYQADSRGFMELTPEQAKRLAEMMGMVPVEDGGEQLPDIDPGVVPPANPGAPANSGGTASPGVSQSVSATSVSQSAAEAGESAGEESKTAHEVSKTENPPNQVDNTPFAAIVGVLLISGLIGVGFFKGSILSFLGFAKK